MNDQDDLKVLLIIILTILATVLAFFLYQERDTIRRLEAQIEPTAYQQTINTTDLQPTISGADLQGTGSKTLTLKGVN